MDRQQQQQPTTTTLPPSSPQQEQRQRQQKPRSIYEMIMSQQPLTSENYSHRAAMHRPVEQLGSSEYSLGSLTRKALPYPLPWTLSATPADNLPPDFSWMSNSCGAKATIGVIGGGAMGLLMGVFLGAFDLKRGSIAVFPFPSEQKYSSFVCLFPRFFPK